MTKMGKVMITFGLIWIFIWCVVGLSLGVGYKAYALKMGDFAEQGNLVEFWKTFSSWKSRSVAHSHALCITFVLILVALTMPYIKLADNIKWITGLLLIIGVVLASIFDWFKFLPLMIVGDILIIAMVLVSFIGALKGVKE